MIVSISLFLAVKSFELCAIFKNDKNMATTIEKRKLGNSGLEVSALGMRCMNLSFGTGKLPI